MSWSRAPVAAALAQMLGAANGGAVFVHERPPEILNGPCIVVLRPTQVSYATAGLAIDEVELPVAIVSGIEQEDAIDGIKNTCRSAVLADQTLGKTVLAAWPTMERNWRNVTGAGGIQLLYVELILQIHA